MTSEANNAFMRLALGLAAEAGEAGEVPVGAVVVKEGEVIGRGANAREATGDPTAHAELIALREAARAVGSWRLEGATLYVTLEPCPMCATAISFARIRRLYFGAYDPKGGGVDHGAKIFGQPTCHHQPEVVGGLEESRAGDLLRGFFQDRR